MAVIPMISEHERLRRRKRLTLTALARSVGVSHAYASRIESGKVPASARYRAAAARTLGVPEDVLFDSDGRVT